MDRRNFIKLCCGGFGLASLFSLLKPRNALVRGLAELKPISTGPVEWSILEKGVHTTYRFYKGPDYTTLEEAFPYMDNIVGKTKGWCRTNETFANSVVILQSVTYGG
jgi:hypothetical protein